MTKRLLFAIILIFSIAGYSSAQPASISSGIDWLVTSQNADKSWGGASSSATPFNTTSAAVAALRFCGNTGSAASDGLNWLNVQPPDSVNFAADRLLTDAIAGLDTASDLNQLVAWKNNIDGSWGLDGEYSNDISEIAITLQALHAVNYSNYSILFQAINFLTSMQNTDGGWGSTVSGASSAYVTAHVLRALVAYNSVFLLQDSINKASSYLLTKQNPDGGFGNSPSTIYDTALSVISMIESGNGNTQTILNGINYLTSSQLADGSWNDDPYNTALALQALAAARPNLTVSSISLSKPMPQENETITITATVRNIGYEDASGIIVRFYLGDPSSGGIQIGSDQIIPSLSVNSSAQVSITASFTGTGGKTIFVVADPDGLISETSEADNKASTRIWVATAPDLAVFSEDLKPSTYVPASGTAFTLAYTVRNLGESTTEGFDIALYDGNPSSGGSLLQTAHISGLNGTEVRTGTIGVTLTGDGSHILYLTADTGTLIPELSETNNTGSVTIQVGGVQQYADLVAGSITLTPDRPHANDLVTITASVRNEGIEDASSFTVEIFDGSPDSGGTLIYSKAISATKGTEEIITTNWTISSGIHDIYLIADRSNQINETNETNNQTSVKVMTDMVDITVSATDLTFIPAHPVNGDTVVLSITVHNTGIKDTGPFNLALYDGDPASGGALLQTFTISNITGDGKTTLPYTFTAIPWTYRFYAIADTENAVVEMYEDNNQAIRSLKIKAPGEILGPDNAAAAPEHTSILTSSQTLIISGNVHATFKNAGDTKSAMPFSVLIFEDTDKDNAYTPEADKKLYEGKYAIGQLDNEQPPVIVIVIHNCDHPSYLGERVYLLAHDGKIAWGPVYLNELDPETPFASYESVPIITDLDGDGQAEIKIKGNSKEFVIDMDGYLKQKREID